MSCAEADRSLFTPGVWQGAVNLELSVPVSQQAWQGFISQGGFRIGTEAVKGVE